MAKDETAVKFGDMIDLARTPADIKARDKENPIGPSSGEKYGYGTCIQLDSDMLKKLGIDELPEVGDEYHILAVGKVTSVSSNASESRESNNISIQITMMNVVHEDDMDEDTENETPEEENAEVKRGVYALGGMRAR